ncbi:cadherin-like beta sandwich domain-containing protein [Mucilaginibacter sp.]|jgi:gliding motility-associated-like protein|uniref:cadherin-like beta sandwich domain-containing protein n=1 Tax=Mucilaginibacter sp. TaxID=1882438 RepID=UPI0035694EFA
MKKLLPLLKNLLTKDIRSFFAALFVLVLISISGSTQAQVYYLTSDETVGTNATTDALNRMNYDGSSNTVMVPSFSNSPVAIAQDLANNRLFIYDAVSATKSIKIVTASTGAITGSIPVPYTLNSMRYDAATDYIYFITTNSAISTDVSDALYKVKSTDSTPTLIKSSITPSPLYLALDIPNNRVFVYESTGGSSRGIKTYSLTSNTFTQTATINSGTVKDIAYDPLTDYLYYLTSDDIATSTAATDALNKVQPGGSTTTVIKAAVTASPSQSMILDAGNNRAYIYEGVTANRAIKAVNLTTGDVSTIISLSSLTAGVTVKSMAVPLIPVLSTASASGITSAAATLGGNVTKSDISVSERGVVYSSTNTTPVIGNGTKAANGTGTGIFSQSISGLSGSTTYYVRSYATSGAGTAYGAVISFTTPSNDANLSAFTISAGTLTPSFSAGTISYTASVANSNSTITVTPTKNNANASIKVNNVAVTSGTASGSIGLNVGSNTITTIVTAQDGTTTKTYTTTVTRDKAAQTITFNALPAKNYGNADFTPGASASSSLGVSYASSNSAVATIVGGQIHLTGVGTTTITASQGGDANYLAATNATQTLTVNKAAVTVTATAQTKIYGEADPTFTYTITSGALVAGDAFTGALSRDAGKNIGIYAIIQNTLSLNNNYTLSFVSANLTITKRPITFAPLPATKVYGDAEPGYPFSIVGTLAAGNVTGDLFTREPGETVGVYALSFGNKKIIDPTNGNEIVNNNYDITFVPTNLTITKRVIVLKPEPATKIYGSVDPGFPYRFVTGSVAPAEGMTGTFGRAPGESVGTYALTLGTKKPVNASTGVFTDQNYDISFISDNLTITPKVVSIFSNARSKNYGDIDPQLTTFISGSLVGGDALTGSLVREAGENAGTYAITQGTIALNSNYSYTFIGAVFTINKRPVNVTANAKSKTFGDTDPALTFTADALPNGESFTGQITRTAGEVFGTYPITQGTLALNNNYTLNYTGADLSISKKSINVTAQAQSKTYGDTDPVLTYTADALSGGDTFSGELSREPGNDFGTYAIIQGTLAASTNYTLNYTGANLSISKGTLTYVADHVTRQFQTANPTFTGNVTGFANGDNIASATTGSLSFTSTATIASAQGSYDITGSGLNAANYNFVQDASNSTALTIVASADATLSGLTATQGSINPAFSSNEINYSFNVANEVTSFDLSATANSTYATMEVNGQAFTSGSTKTYTLIPGYNEFNIIVTAQDATTKAYRLGINRAYSANNLLSSISLSGITISPVFNTNTLNYTASVSNLVTSTDIYGVPVDNTATVTVNGSPATTASPANISLGVGENPISILSKAQNGTDRVYIVTVTRAQSSDATLSSLGNSQLTLNTPFVAGTHSYTATVPTNVSSLYFMPVPSNDRATVTVNGQPLNVFSGNYMAIGFSDNALTIDVTSEDGTGHIIYTVAITRVKSADATLTVLNTPFETTINEPFDPNTYAYTATVTDSTLTGLPLTATSADENAVVKINGTVVPRFQNYIMAIHGGENTFNIVVTSQDGSATKTYTLVLTRAGQAPPLLSPVANLFALNVSSGSTFSKNFNFTIGEELTTIYAPNNIASIRVFAVSENAVSTVTVNGVTLPYDTSTDLLPISVGDNLFTVLVTSQDGVHTKTYAVHVNRLPFADVTLASLALNKGTLTPNFTSATTSYTASVKNSISTINVTPVATVSGVTITVNNIAVDAAHPTATINLLGGPPTRIRTVVTAADGINTKTYTVNVTRLAPQPTLASLTLSAGTLSPAFDEDVFAYAATVSNATTSLTLTPVTTDATATITINGDAIASGAASGAIPLNVGANTLSTVVTSQDGLITKTYTVVVNRPPSSNVGIQSVNISSAPLVRVGNTDNFTASVNSTISSIRVTAATIDPNAIIKVNGVVVANLTESALIPLQDGTTNINLQIIAADGVTSRTISLAISKIKSTNVGIESIHINSGPLTRVGNTDNFTASVSATTSSIKVTAITIDPNAIIKINEVVVANQTESAPIPLQVGTTNINVQIIAEDRITSRTVSLSVSRTGSNNVGIQSLHINSGPLARIGNTDNFTASVSATTSSIKITAVTIDPNALIKVNDVVTANQTESAPILLQAGTTNINVQIIAEDGITSRNVSLAVSRIGSNNVGMQSVNINSGPLVRVGNTDNFTASVGNTVSNLKMTIVPNDVNSTITINGITLTSGYTSGTIPLSVGPNTITASINAEDGITKRNLLITVIRASMGTISFASNKIQKLNPESFNTPIEVQAVVIHQGLSPNGDGINDFLNIEGIGQYQDNQVMVMNRSGEVIYTAKGYNNSSVVFDGHASNGKLQLPGTYFYSLDYKQGKEAKRKTGYIVIKY